jgi:uncharacterized protein (DUF433 family)
LQGKEETGAFFSACLASLRFDRRTEKILAACEQIWPNCREEPPFVFVLALSATKPDYSSGLQSFPSGRIVGCIDMNAKASEQHRRVELGRHIVADSKICGGQPTFKGTRIMVWIVLEQLEDGMTWDEVVGEWLGKVSKQAIAEAIAIADVVVKHEPFRGFNVGARRKPARRPTALAA